MVNEITRESVINSLESRGYHAEKSDVVKNGVHLNGICIRNERDIAPCFYLDDFVKRFDTVDEIAEQMINIYESKKSFSFDISVFSNHDWILEHLFIAVQKSSDEELIKKDTEFHGIEQFLYIRGNDSSDNWSVKLNTGIMIQANISSDEAWKAAEKNTFADGQTVIKSMVEVLSEMMGNDDLFGFGDEIPMFVLTNPSKTKGASQILDKEAIKNFFNSLSDCPKRLILIPSSIHEWIIIPATDDNIDLGTFESMINEVNSTQVEATEQLGNRAYILEL